MREWGEGEGKGGASKQANTNKSRSNAAAHHRRSGISGRKKGGNTQFDHSNHARRTSLCTPSRFTDYHSFPRFAVARDGGRTRRVGVGRGRGSEFL